MFNGSILGHFQMRLLSAGYQTAGRILQETQGYEREKGSEDNSPFQAIPNEVLILIFSSLPAKDLMSCFLVNRRWCEAGNEDFLWKNLCLQAGIVIPNPNDSAFEEYCRFQPKRISKKKYTVHAKTCGEMTTLFSSFKQMSGLAWHQGLFAYSTLTEEKTRMLDLTTGICVKEIEEGTRHVDFDRDSIVTTQINNTVIFKSRKLSNEGRSRTQSQNSSLPRIDRFSLYGDKIFATVSKSVLQLDRNTLQPDLAFPHAQAVSTLAMSESVLATGSTDGTVSLWDVKSAESRFNHKDRVEAVKKMELQDQHLVVSFTSAIQIWDIRNSGCLHEIPTPCPISTSNAHRGILAIAEGRHSFILTELTHCNITLWDIQSGVKIKELYKKQGAIAVPWGIRWTDSSLIQVNAIGSILTCNFD